MTPLEETTRNQRLAATPVRSAFVMANAGAGKTRVLTNRVARLLLEDASPDKILCITFTKAAAAEMADRLFTELGKWALMDDDALLAAISELEGPDALSRAPEALNKARRLFARALETPGGLKIQTIHSFCESVLRRFPLEAGAPPGFTILEDGAAKQLLNDAIDMLARRAVDEPELAEAFSRLSTLRNEKDLRGLLAAYDSFRLETAISTYGDLEGILTALSQAFGTSRNQDSTNIYEGFIRAIDEAKFEEARIALLESGKNAQKFCAAPIGAYQQASDIIGKWAALRKLFLKTDGKPRDKFGDKSTEKNAPWAEAYLKSLQSDFLDADELAKTVSLYQDTVAFYKLSCALHDAYSRAKNERAALDFNDLISRTRTLFSQVSSAWIMYKLDHGIDHILLDEAQDTSPMQWRVIEALLEDYLSGAGAREDSRTFFAVGDMKQSIYSFQGADAVLFEEKETDLGKRLNAAGDYKNVDLRLSFRTTAPVLEFVDNLFAAPEAAEGLGHRGVPAHMAKRAGDAGLVEIWPLTPRPENTRANPWDAPVDEPTTDHPVRVLSDRIARLIKDWRAKDTLLESQNRPISPGDIMILVQSRGALFDEMIRALSLNGVPVAGADRLKLLEDPAVEDLVSYAKFAVTTADDLSLAEILKSPLFGFDDDQDLFPLAYGRNNKRSLWASLNARADEQPRWREALTEISIARSVGLKQGPFAFLSHILETGKQSGRKRFYERLGAASRDAIDEMLRQALEFENARPRSLRAFINWFEENAGDIKREMERADNAVRVMTVHGAKGLEANIVFLLDAHKGPNLSAQDPVQSFTHDAQSPDGRENLSAFVGAADRNIPLTIQMRDDRNLKTYEEYRRLLYVAATRARDRLYICGLESGNVKAPRDKATSVKSWHALAEDALDRLGDKVLTAEAPFWSDDGAPLRRYESVQAAPVEKKELTQEPSTVETPKWLFAPAQAEPARMRLAPSRLADDEEATVAPEEAPAISPAHGDKYFRGRTLHRLLELLPQIDPAARAQAADRFLERAAGIIEQAERNRWRDEVLNVLEHSQFARVFSSSSRAEVSIAGAPKGAKPGLTITGQIDRLVIDEDKILFVDYKTNRPPPDNIDDVSPAYMAQMAAYRSLLQEIYPHHQIEAALLWTFDARLMALPNDDLDHAFARWLKAG